MPDPDDRHVPERPQPQPSHGEELFGVSGDPGQTGPIRAHSGDTSPFPLRIGDWEPDRAPQPDPRAEPPPARPPGQPAQPGPPVLPPAGPPRRVSGRGVAVVLGVLLVLVLPVAVLWATQGGDVTPGRPTPGGPPQPVVRTDTGAALVERATRTDTDCAAHSYGRVREYLAATPCTSLRRALHTAEGSRGAVAVSVSRVVMASPQDAAGLQRLTDTDGTGNVADLLREGVRVDPGPSRLRDASYASRRDGSAVVIVEAASVAGGGDDLDALAEAALVLGR